MKKPWSELDDVEKCETMAELLGWTRSKEVEGFWLRPGWIGTRPLGRWALDDGLAFEEVWKKMVANDNFLMLSMSHVSSPTVFRDAIGGPDPIADGSTWADAICHAYYDLTKEPKCPTLTKLRNR